MWSVGISINLSLIVGFFVFFSLFANQFSVLTAVQSIYIK